MRGILFILMLFGFSAFSQGGGIKSYMKTMCDSNTGEPVQVEYSVSTNALICCFDINTGVKLVTCPTLQSCGSYGHVSSLVCADNLPSLRQVVINPDGTETIKFIDDSGSEFIPVEWAFGACSDAVIEMDMCDKNNEKNSLYAAQNTAPNVFDISIVNPITGANTVISTINTSDFNSFGLDIGNGFLYGINRVTAELLRVDIATGGFLNLGVITGLPILPVNLNFGDFNNSNGFLYVGGANTNVYEIDVQNIIAQQASSFALDNGAGDMAFDECGLLYVSADGVIKTYASDFGSGVLVTTIPDNGSGFGGSFAYQDGTLFGAYGDNSTFIYDLATGNLSNGLPVAGGPLYDYGMSPSNTRYVSFKRLFRINTDGTLGTFTDARPDGTTYEATGKITVGICEDCNCIKCEIPESGGGTSSSVSVTNFPSLQQVEFDYKELATEVVSAQRNVNGDCVSFSGTNDETLGLPIGTTGKLNYIGDHGGGFVRLSTDGTSPTTDAYPEFNARHTLNLNGVDLGNLIFNGSAANSDYTVCFEIYQ